MADLVTQVESGAPKHDKRFLHGEPGLIYMLSLGLMVASFSAVETITNNMIPITCRKFTDSAILMSMIIALNPFFGFVVQPYVAWRSDHTVTRFGRRRPFLMLGLPTTMLSVLLIGSLPYIFTGNARSSMLAMVILVIANFALQFFQDVNGGVNEPLYADTFKQEKLGRAVGIRSYATTVVLFTMNAIALIYAARWEWFPYALCGFWLAIAVLIVFFVVRERPSEQPKEKPRYNIVSHLGLLAENPDYLKLAVIASLGLVLPSALMLFNSLYITSQLGLPISVLGQAAFVGPIVTLCFAWPVGYMVDRFGPKYLMFVGFTLMTLVSAGMAFWAHDRLSIIVLMNLNHISGIFFWTAMTPMVFQYAASNERGSVFGLIQFVRGMARFLVTALLGFVVQYSYSYTPTQLYPDDLKKGAELIKSLKAEKDPVSQLISQHLSPETKELLQKPLGPKGPVPEVGKAIVADLNKLAKGPSIYNEERFKNVEISGQSEKLINKGELSDDERFVLNRTLITDAYPEVISKKLNYRATYFVNIAFGVIAALLVLTAKRGKFAKTIKDEQ